MRLHGTTSRPRHLAPGLILTAAMAVTLGACSASGSTATQHAASSRSAAPASDSATPASSTPAPVAAGTASGLSGKWTGQYSGSYAGTFILRWQATGSQLSGTIQLSFPQTAEHVTGTVAGGSIRFGTVGSSAITYSGTVSGNSMSGTYQVHDARNSGGQWSASKSS